MPWPDTPEPAGLRAVDGIRSDPERKAPCLDHPM